MATSGAEARRIADDLKTDNIVLKAQVLAGGRGKGAFKNGLKGGVRLVYSSEEAEQIAGKMINQVLVTKQTGAAGRMCNKVMVAERKFPRREFYFAVMMERAFNVSFRLNQLHEYRFVNSNFYDVKGPVLIASSQGGVNIEEVAVENPDAILYEPIDIVEGLKPDQARRIAEKVGLGNVADQISKTLINMYDLFIKKDATLIEINPYAEDAFDTSKCELIDR